MIKEIKEIKEGFLNTESSKYELLDTTELIYYSPVGLSGYEVLKE